MIKYKKRTLLYDNTPSIVAASYDAKGVNKFY